MKAGHTVEDQNSAKLKEEISNFFEDLMYDYGGSPLLGRIYSICVMDESWDETEQKKNQNYFVDEFKVNPSTISRNLKELESWNLINKRREPGSREWQYQLNDTSFLELFLYNFEQTKGKLRDKQEELDRIKNHWTGLVNDKKFQSLNKLRNWMKTVEDELDIFITDLNKKYLEFEKKNNLP